MHEKLVKQLRNTEHCSGCPYDKDCNEFDSCLMDLLAADAIEDLSKRIARQEKELQEKDKYIKDIKYLREFFTKYYKEHCQYGDVYVISNDGTIGKKIGVCSILKGK